MTFIASVIAKEGVALIADSLVTTTLPTIHFNEFVDFLKLKEQQTDKQEIVLSPVEIIDLFKNRPSHTKNYEDKLFELDKFTAITTAGAASINNKRIKELIENYKLHYKKDQTHNRKKIETKINDLCNFIISEIKLHLREKTSIRPTKFIITHFDRNKNKTIIFKINVLSASEKELQNDKFKYIEVEKANDWEKVVCDGQNRISEKILYGGIADRYQLIPKVAFRVINDFGIKLDDNQIFEYIKGLNENREIISLEVFEEMKILKLSELSLQQAVDLANLLMRLEIDFQTYTENIPTVGGVVKIAIINNLFLRKCTTNLNIYYLVEKFLT